MNIKKSFAYYILIIILLSSVFCCKNNSCVGANDTDSIIVFYYKGWVEFPIRKSLVELAERAMEKNIDTIIYLKDNDYNRVLSIINKRQYIDNQDVDCRMLVQHDSVKIALGYPDIFIPESNDTCIFGYDYNFKRIQVNANNIYYLRYICGYYNWFPKEELMYDKLIRKCGLPINYCDMSGKGVVIKSNADIIKEKTHNIVTATKISNENIIKISNSRKVVIKKSS